MLGDDLAAALPELRAHAESMMLDACTITGPGSAPVWDEATGEWSTPGSATVYQGKCRVQRADGPPAGSQAGSADWSLNHVRVDLPVATSTAVREGHVVTITAAAFDPQLVGVVATVVGEHHKTLATARRLQCEEVSRDA